ncbi:MAG: signal peptidase II [Steroidobacteraceae bacterium]
MSDSVVRKVPWMQSGWRWLPLSFALIVFDQWTKAWIERHYELGEYTPVFFWLDIIRLHNPGAAFSFLADAGGWQRKVRLKTEPILAIALALVLSGAVGNVIDRIEHGYVVDFIHVHWQGAYFPAFNIADSAITIGAILLLWDAFADWRRQR